MQKSFLQKGAVTLQQLIIAFGAIVGGSIWVATSNCIGVDPDTGLTCQEVLANPEQDIYYIVDVATVENSPASFNSAHEKLSTARHNVAGDKIVMKFDASEVPDGIDLGDPFSHDAILSWLATPSNGFITGEETATDDIIYTEENEGALPILEPIESQ